MSDAVVSAALARLTAAFPGWHDATDNPHPTPDARLPSYAVAVTYTAAERVGMGDNRTLREGQLEVELQVATTATSASATAGIHAHAKAMQDALMAAPADLGGTVWQIIPEGFEADHDRGESRITRGALIFTIQTLEPGA